MAGRSGFRHAAWSTIHELQGARLDPEDLEAARKDFEEFTEDFATWVFFYGPEGGEALR